MMWEFFLNTSRRTHVCLPCGPQWRKLVRLFRKKHTRFYWYDFKVRGIRHRASTKETNLRRAEKIAALKLSLAMEGSSPLDRKVPILQEFSSRFLTWVEAAKLQAQSKTYYRDGWRLLSVTKIVGMRLDHITGDDMDALTFSGSASNGNCALRTLRRMFHKAQEWDLEVYPCPCNTVCKSRLLATWQQGFFVFIAQFENLRQLLSRLSE